MTKFTLDNNATAGTVHLEMSKLSNLETTDIMISSDHFNAEDMQFLIKFLQKKESKVRNLSLLSQNIDDEQVVQLCAVLQKAGKIQVLEIGANTTTKGLEAIEKLVNVKESNITTLRLANVQIERDHMATFISEIDQSKVSKLSLSDCDFEDETLLDDLVSFLNQNTCRIDTFAMSGRNITDLEISKIAKLNGSNITNLYIGGQETILGDESVNQSMPDLADCLQRDNSKIETLQLHQGRIGANEMRILGKILKNSKIKKLEISNNNIGDLSDFINLLKDDKCHLTDLKIESCGLNEADVDQLLDVLKSPQTSLERISLDGNVDEKTKNFEEFYKPESLNPFHPEASYPHSSPSFVTKEDEELLEKILMLELEVNKKDREIGKIIIEDEKLQLEMREIRRREEFIRRNWSSPGSVDEVEFDRLSAQFQKEENKIGQESEEKHGMIESESIIEDELVENVQEDEKKLQNLRLKIKILEEECNKKDQVISELNNITLIRAIELQILINNSRLHVNRGQGLQPARWLRKDEIFNTPIRETRKYNSYHEVMEDILQRSKDDNGNFKRHPIFAFLDSPVELHDYLKGKEFDISLFRNDPRYQDNNIETTECVEYIKEFYCTSKELYGFKSHRPCGSLNRL